MTRAVYAIRHQSAGVTTSKLYVSRPDDDELLRVAQGLGPGWTRVVPIPLCIPDEASAIGDYLDEFPTEEPPPPEPSGVPGLRFRALGVIAPPTEDA